MTHSGCLERALPAEGVVIMPCVYCGGYDGEGGCCPDAWAVKERAEAEDSYLACAACGTSGVEITGFCPVCMVDCEELVLRSIKTGEIVNP